MNSSFIAAPMSRNAIREIALLIREVIGLKDKDLFPVIPFIENGLAQIDEEFVLEIKDITSMKEYGIAYPEHRKIVLREDVYVNAIKGVPRDRFTVAHELVTILCTDLNELVLRVPMRNRSHIKIPNGRQILLPVSY